MTFLVFVFEALTILAVVMAGWMLWERLFFPKEMRAYNDLMLSRFSKIRVACRAFKWVMQNKAVMINVKMELTGTIILPDKPIWIHGCMFTSKTPNNAIIQLFPEEVFWGDQEKP